MPFSRLACSEEWLVAIMLFSTLTCAGGGNKSKSDSPPPRASPTPSALLPSAQPTSEHKEEEISPRDSPPQPYPYTVDILAPLEESNNPAIEQTMPQSQLPVFSGGGYDAQANLPDKGVTVGKYVVYCNACNRNQIRPLPDDPIIAKCPNCSASRYIYRMGNRRVFTICLDGGDNKPEESTLQALFDVTRATYYSEDDQSCYLNTTAPGTIVLSAKYRKDIITLPTCRNPTCSSTGESFRIPCCQQEFCHKCIKSSFKKAMKKKSKMTCPNKECEEPLPHALVERLIKESKVRKYLENLYEKKTPLTTPQIPATGDTTDITAQNNPSDKSHTRETFINNVARCVSCMDELPEGEEPSVTCENCLTITCRICHCTWNNIGYGLEGHICRINDDDDDDN